MKSNWKYAGLLVLIVLLTISPAYAQQFAALKDPQPTYRNFSVMQGLPSSETYFVHQDREGYIWICTDRGVVRFDGYRFRVFTVEDGLEDNVVFSVREDRLGRIWFLTKNVGLCYYHKGKIRSFRHNAALKRAIGQKYSVHKDVLQRDDGTVLYTIKGYGWLTISPDGKIDATHLGEVKSGKDRVILQKEGSDYVCLMHSSVEQSLSPEAEPIPTFLHTGKKSVYLGQYPWYTAVRMRSLKGQLFVVNGQRVLQLRNKKLEEVAFADHSVISVCNAGNQLWIGKVDEGVSFCDLSAEGKLIPRGDLLPGLSVSHVLRDRDGGLWFSTLENGVYYAPNPGVRSLTVREGIPFRNVLEVNGVGADVYAASGSRSCKQLNAPWKFIHDNAETQHRYWLLRIGNRILMPDEPLWERAKMEHVRYTQNDAYRDGDRLILCTGGRIISVNPDFSTEVLYEDTANRSRLIQSYAVAIDDRERLYHGGLLGLAIVENGKRHVPDDPIAREQVSDIVCHEKWGAVVGTRNKGIYAVRNGKVWMRLTVAKGLLSDIINLVKVDEKGRLWVGSNKGICIVDPETLRITYLTAMNGLVSSEINDFYFYGDRIWVATKKGVSIIETAAVLRDPGFRPLLLNELESSGKSFPAATEFASGTPYVKITFRTSDYRSSAVRRFRYRMQADGEWVYAQAPEILLTKPNSDDYVVQVSYMNVSGHWSPPTTLTRFTILPPYYLRWYFIAFLVLLVIVLMFLLFRARIRQINRRNNLRETINKLEQKALRAQMNPHFIFNSLNSIQSFLIYEENEKAEKYLLRFARLIRQTLNNSRESYIAIESEMETLRGYLELEQMRFKEKFTFEITCGLSTDEQQWGVPPMLIQPFVENAVLHGFRTMETGGRIEVRFEKLENQRLLCIVEDNGIGRKATMKAKAEGHKSFGTKITEERLAAFRQKYGDEFSIETIDKEADGKSEGTKIVMHIPVVGPGEFEESEAF